MKTTHPARLNHNHFRHRSSEQPVRLIKAAQASKLLGTTMNGHHEGHGADGVRKKPEIPMIHAGTDYCDLEITCGCGESTQVRCWNSPAREEKVAA
jgi:hypothetical protein